MGKLIGFLVGLTTAVAPIATHAQRSGGISDGHSYPVEGAWSAIQSQYATTQTCTWYEEGFLREKRNVPLPGDLIVYEDSKRTDFGGYYGEAGTVSNLASVKQLHPNSYRIIERYYQDEEGGQTFGWKRRTYDLKVLGDHTIEIREDKTVQKFQLCKVISTSVELSGPTRAKEESSTSNEPPADKPAEKASSTPAPAPSQPSKPDQLALSSNPVSKPPNKKPPQSVSLPAGVKADWASSIDDCLTTPKENFLAVVGGVKDGTIYLNGESCKLDGVPQDLSDPPFGGYRMNLSCASTKRQLILRRHELKFASSPFGAIAVDGQSPSVMYHCGVVRDSVSEGASPASIAKNRIAITKSFLGGKYDTYLYAKTCKDYGYMRNFETIQAIMREIDDLAKSEGFNTDALWQAAVDRGRQNTVLNILKQGFELMKSGAGSAVDTAKAFQGCEKYTTLFRSLADDLRQAQNPERLLEAFNAGRAPR